MRNLDRLRCFLAVVEHEQVNRAADALGYGASVVGQRIRQLEQEWGLTLFTRQRGRLVLSSAGEALAPLARRIVDQIDTLDATAADLAAGHRGDVVIAYRHNAGAWVTRLMRAIVAERPAVNVKPKAMEHHDVIAAVTSGAADLGIAGRDDSVECLDLGRDPLAVLAVPRSHRLSGVTAVTIRDLHGEPYVLDDRADHDQPRQELVDFFREQSVEPDYHLATINSAQDLLTLVGAGAGVALVRVPFADSERHAENVTFRPVRGATPAILDSLVWSRTNDAPLVSWCVDLVARTLAGGRR